MENQKFCQSCAMPLTNGEDFGTNADGSRNGDYCRYCYVAGSFTTDETMEEFIESCVPHTSENNPWPDEDTARSEMAKLFPKLKRWAKA